MGVGAATAGFVCWQAWETRKAAEAAKRNAVIFVEIERPWIIVDIGNIPNFTPDQSQVQVLWVSPTFTNQGRTAARTLRLAARQHQLSHGESLPLEPEYPEPINIDLIVPVNTPMQPIPVGINAADFQEIWPGNRRLYIYGFVDYLDSAGINRQTRFCYRYRVPAGFAPGQPGFYIATDAPPAYIRFT